MSWKRRLKVDLPFALVCGGIVFAILSVAAWYNLRSHYNVCRRQGWSRLRVQSIHKQIENYREKHGALPHKLTDIPELKKSADRVEDRWQRPIQYRATGDSYELFSLGRDGQPGGEGLDADLYHDDRNKTQSLTTFRQWFTEDDREEVDRGNFYLAGLMAALLVASIAFRALSDLDSPDSRATLGQFIVYCVVIIGFASVIGVVLLPFHIPSGH